MLLGVFLPLFNFIVLACFGRRLGQIGTIYYTCWSLFWLLLVNGWNVCTVLFNYHYFSFKLAPWIQIGGLSVHWEFMLDFLAVSMLGMVSIISSAVHLYSFAYMKEDPFFIRFISYISLFTFFMFILVSAANLLVLFVGWEGVGICSYLLINFWYTRSQANKAALKALLMNRVGDVGFLLGTVCLFWVCRTLDFAVLEVVVTVAAMYAGGLDSYLGYGHDLWSCVGVMDVISLFFFIGVMGKSAQLGLHTWLPAAMEGPTPVSALIHAATMVTAGIFLLIRCSFLFECSAIVRNLVVILGVITAFASALTACVLYDMKRIIAYSTCSQLGYMAIACGMSQYTLGLFHLINHAFFKALLFLTAGAIIHSFNNEQDIRKLSNVANKAPFLHACMLVGSIAIMGLPFLSGFYSKDVIIEVAFLKTVIFQTQCSLVYYLILFATISTAIYSSRLYFYLFLREGVSQLGNSSFMVPMRQPFFIQVALSVLLVGSLFSGFLLQELYLNNTVHSVSVGTNVFSRGGDAYALLQDFSNSFYYPETAAGWQQHGCVLVELWFQELSGGVFLETEFLNRQYKLLPFFGNIVVLVAGFVGFYWYSCGSIFNTAEYIYISWVVSKPGAYRISRQSWESLVLLAYFWLEDYGVWFKKLLFNNFYFNEVYNYISYMFLVYCFTNVFLNLDKGVVEWIGPTGIARSYAFLTKWVKNYYKMPFSLIFCSILYSLLWFFFLGFYFI